MRQLSRRSLAALLLFGTSACGQGDDAAVVATDAGSRGMASGGANAAAPAPSAPASMGFQREMRGTSRRSKATIGSAGGSDLSMPAPAVLSQQVPAAGAGAADAAMLIRTATAAVEVAALEEAVAAARRSAVRFGGTVANAHVETGRHEIHRAVLQIRVPAVRFDSLLAGLAPLGRVESVQVSAQDVGEEYVDIEARLANLRRLEARMVELLANRTGRLSDVLSVERELARVRGEIEQIEGRRRFLERSMAVSTLDLSLHEPVPIIAGTPGSNPIAAAVRDAWRLFVASIAWCIAALGVLVPVALVGALLWFVGRRWWPWGAPARATSGGA